MSKILTPDAQADRDDFKAWYGSDGNCSCHLSPPCGNCTHPGNPRNQAEDDDAWMEEWLGFDAMEQQAREAVAAAIEMEARRHLEEMNAAALRKDITA